MPNEMGKKPPKLRSSLIKSEYEEKDGNQHENVTLMGPEEEQKQP